MERRHEQEWARMAQEGDHTFQEVSSMTSLPESVKLLPWCISAGITDMMKLSQTVWV